MHIIRIVQRQTFSRISWDAILPRMPREPEGLESWEGLLFQDETVERFQASNP